LAYEDHGESEYPFVTVESAETLLKTPRIGRIVPELSQLDLREAVFRAQDAHFNSSFL